jgi:hypothetical protein
MFEFLGMVAVAVAIAAGLGMAVGTLLDLLFGDALVALVCRPEPESDVARGIRERADEDRVREEAEDRADFEARLREEQAEFERRMEADEARFQREMAELFGGLETVGSGEVDVISFTTEMPDDSYFDRIRETPRLAGK